MNKNQEIEVSTMVLGHCNRLIKAHLHNMTVSTIARSYRQAIKKLKTFEHHCSSQVKIDEISLSKKYEKFVLNHLELNQFTQLTENNLNLSKESYLPLVVLQKDFTPVDISCFQLDFAEHVFEEIKTYSVCNLGTNYRKPLGLFLSKVQKQNPVYFRLLGFRTDHIEIDNFEQQVRRLMKKFELNI